MLIFPQNQKNQHKEKFYIKWYNSSMIYLQKANLKDAKKEYELSQKIPAQENGFENKAYGVSFDDFVSKTIPRWLDYDKGLNLDEGHVPDTCYFLWVDDTHYYTRIPL